MSLAQVLASHGEYELLHRNLDVGYFIRRQDRDGHYRTVAFVNDKAEWGRFVAALVQGYDETLAVRAIDFVVER